MWGELVEKKGMFQRHNGASSGNGIDCVGSHIEISKNVNDF